MTIESIRVVGLAFLCLCVGLIGSAGAETPATKPVSEADVVTLLDSKTSKLPEIASAIRLGNWPAVTSVRAKRGQPEAAQNRNRQYVRLSRRLLEKMSEFEQQAGELNAEETSRAVVTYLSLAKKLNECGGYVNLLLADSAKRLAAAHALRFTVKHPTEAKSRQQWSEQFEGNPFPIRELADAVSTETTRHHAELSIEGKSGPEAAEALLKLLGTSNENAMMASPKDQTITVLIDDVSVDILLGRAMFTDFLSRNEMAALVVFLNRGGKVETLTASDDAEFTRVMGDTAKLFGSKTLRIPEISVDQLRALVEDVSSEHPKIIAESLK